MAAEVFGVTRGSRREPKDTWWWNDEVQVAIKEKKECYKSLHHHRSDENIQKYKIARGKTKKAVSEAKSQAYEDLYRKLNTKEDEKDVYSVGFCATCMSAEFKNFHTQTPNNNH